jgi:hypothetical protein
MHTSAQHAVDEAEQQNPLRDPAREVRTPISQRT